MEFKGAQANNAGGGQQPAAPRFPSHNNMGGHMGNDSNKKVVWIVAGVIAVALIACVAWWGWKNMSGASGSIKTGQYQALFLTNGQVYFGKLSNVDEKYVKLTDIYYLQVQQTVQPAQKDDDNKQPQVSLAKLGSELHGPEDMMQINRDQVLFWENLKDDSKVVKAIKDNQK